MRRRRHGWARGTGPRRLAEVVLWCAFAAGLAAAAALSVRYHLRFDWTANRVNTLSEVSRETLAALSGPVAITVAARRGSFTRAHAADLVERYRTVKPDLRLRYLDPSDQPLETRALELTDNAASVAFGGRLETTRDLSEEGLTAALLRVREDKPRRVVSLLGQGQRRLLGEANHDLGLFARRLRTRGFAVEEIDVLARGAVPPDVDLLVASQPPTDPLPQMHAAVSTFLVQGGNVLWLAEPRAPPRTGLGPLTELLGVRGEPGALVQPKAGPFRALSPVIVVASSYPPHPATQGLRAITVFPTTTGLSGHATSGSEWRRRLVLEAGVDSWIDPSALGPGGPGTKPPAGPRSPVPFGLSYARRVPAAGRSGAGGEQRVVVLGDGDFLSNRYLANQGNLELGLRLVEWLTAGSRTLPSPAARPVDRDLVLSGIGLQLLALAAVVGLPGGLLLAGLLIRLRRRRRARS